MPARKEAEDFGDLVNEQLPKLLEVAQRESLAAAVEQLFQLEKQTRNGGDYLSTTRVARAIVRLCFDHKDFQQMNDSLVLISKRRGQEKQVIRGAVQEAMSTLDMIDDLNTKLTLIATLRNITEGKIFAELERAELTRLLAKIKESQGDLKGAAKILQEVQVETLNTMEKKEKVEYIEEQMRLCLECKDYIRVLILSRKINTATLNSEGFEDLKVRFYTLMNFYHAHEKNYLEIARGYQSIYNTPKIQADENDCKKYMKHTIVFGVLSPHSNDQHDLINRFYLDKNTRDIPEYKALLKHFLTMEIMRWPQIEQVYKDIIPRDIPAFGSADDGKVLWDDLRLRAVQHNIRVISRYYQRISASRFAELLSLTPEEAELRLSDLVAAGSTYAKVDRPKGIISFTKPKEATESLNDWSRNVSDLLNLLEKTCHLIHRENMVHGLQ